MRSDLKAAQLNKGTQREPEKALQPSSNGQNMNPWKLKRRNTSWEYSKTNVFNTLRVLNLLNKLPKEVVNSPSFSASGAKL